MSKITVSIERLNKHVSPGRRREVSREEEKEAPAKKEKARIDFSIQEGD